MKDLIATIDNIYEYYYGKASTLCIENLIIDSIILLCCEKLGVYSTDIAGIDESRNQSIINSEAYNMLKRNSSKITFDSPDTIQAVYEYIVKKDTDKREKYGIYYTPKWLTTYIVENAFEGKVIQEQSLYNTRILEPSCGCGIFLTCVFDAIYNFYKRNTDLSPSEIVSTIFEKNLYGVDIDERAFRICKFVLMLKAFTKTNELKNYEFNLYNIDFLTDERIDSKSYDVIIGNPPYLENRKINKYYSKDYLKEMYSTAKGRFDIYSLFIEKSIKILKKNGYLSFILPGNLLANNNFVGIRKLMLKKTCILEIINLGEGIFTDVGMNMIVITILNNPNNTYNKIRCKNIYNNPNKIKAIYDEDYKYIQQKYYHNTLMNVFDIDSSDITFNMRERLFTRNYLKVNDICEIVAGIATGNIKNKLITRNAHREYTKKVLEGKNVFPYRHIWQGSYFIEDKTLIDRNKGEYATFMRKDFVEGEKILIRQTADRFICSYDNEDYYILNTLYSLKIRGEFKNRVEIKFILALLNSKLYSFLYRSLIREEGKLFPQLKIFHIQHSPLILPTKKVQNEIKKLTDIIIQNYRKLYSHENMSTSLKNELNYEISINTSIIDKMIYRIYSLSDEEISEIERIMDK